MVLRVLFLAFFIVTSCPGILAASELKIVEVPFVMRNGAVVLPIQVKGTGPFNIAIATGSSRSTLSWEVHTKLGYQTLFYIDPLTAKQITYAQVSGIQIGEWKIDTLNMKLGELDAYSKELGVPLHGIFGHDFLKKQPLQVDYKNNVVRFFPKGLGDKDPTSNQTSPQSTKTIIQMEITSEEPVPVIKGILVNGLKIKALVDSWQNLALSLSPAALKELKIQQPPEKTRPQVSIINSLQVGELKQESVKTAFYSKGTGLDHGLSKYGAILGAGFLSNYIVTFDYSNKQVIFQ